MALQALTVVLMAAAMALALEMRDRFDQAQTARLGPPSANATYPSSPPGQSRP